MPIQELQQASRVPMLWQGDESRQRIGPHDAATAQGRHPSRVEGLHPEEVSAIGASSCQMQQMPEGDEL